MPLRTLHLYMTPKRGMQSCSFCTMNEALLTVLSILMCSLGLFAGLGNAATMTFIALTPKLRRLTFGKLLFNLAVSGKSYAILSPESIFVTGLVKFVPAVARLVCLEMLG